MFGVVPRALWAKVCQPDDRNRIPLACNCLLLRRADALVLVEAGCGDRFTDKDREIYDIGATSLESALGNTGVRAADITHVLLTHLHFDHVAGTLTSRGKELQPLCENALHLTQKGEWDDALAGRSILKSSYISGDLEALAGSVRWQFLEGDEEILPGLSVRVTGGHTQHHQAILVRDGGMTLVYPGDLIPTRAHLSPYWIMAYDMAPYRTFTSKLAMAEEAAADGWILAWDHDPESTFCTLAKGESRYEAVPFETS